jgi:molybdopterin-containing oxidoreductase family iron-sulfur binding subunit
MSEPREKLDLAAVRARLDGARGRDYWRSLDDLASTPEFRDLVEREFPQQAIGWSDDEDPAQGRRNFLKLMGASLALAGLTGCTRQPTEYITPYVRQPEDLIPGRPLFYATATTLSGVATGVLAESHEGRPTKMEGNREHPGSLGACDAYSQAAVLQLYDPDRAQTVTLNGEIRSWEEFFGGLREVLVAQAEKRGGGIRILTETITSPTVATQIAAIQKLYPAMKWHQWEPAGAHSSRGGAVQAFGTPVNTYLRFHEGQCSRRAGFRFHVAGAGEPSLRASICGAAPCGGRTPLHEPAVRGGADAHCHWHARGPSHSDARHGNRQVRAGVALGLERPSARTWTRIAAPAS